MDLNELFKVEADYEIAKLKRTMTREEQINAVAVSKGIEFKNNLIKESVSEGIARMYSNIAVSYFEKGAKYADEHPDIEAIKAIEDHAYFAGSEAMREKMTNKACEWLKDNWRKHVRLDGDNIILFGLWENDFRKAMEGCI